MARHEHDTLQRLADLLSRNADIQPRIWAEVLARNLVDSADFLPYRERILKERRQTWIR